MLPYKVKRFLWYLNRPKYYPQFFYLIIRKIAGNNKLSPEKHETEAWYRERSVSTSDAILKVTGTVMAMPVEEKYQAVFDKAKKIADKCPVKMGGAGNLDLLYWIAEILGVTRVIETGVAYGWSSLTILLSLKNRDNSKLISTDMPYPTRNNESYVGVVVPEELKVLWKMINYPDRQAIPVALKEFNEIDMCHYDSDKTYPGRMWTYSKLWEKLRIGGVFISDDVGDNNAFRDFAEKIRSEPIIVESSNKFIGIIIKDKID